MKAIVEKLSSWPSLNHTEDYSQLGGGWGGLCYISLRYLIFTDEICPIYSVLKSCQTEEQGLNKFHFESSNCRLCALNVLWFGGISVHLGKLCCLSECVQ
ncbi:UNVERIFIED_CONTAM: hypothetical protein K2H54_010396 [Gekko kuhli]